MKKYLAPVILLLTIETIFAQKKMTDENLIREARATSNDAIARKDIDALSNFWLPDLVVVRGNGTSEKGKEAIVAIWKEMFKTNPEQSFIRTPSEVTIKSDATMAWEKGTWEGINSYSKGGNYSAMWRKKDGIWKIQAELYVALR